MGREPEQHARGGDTWGTVVSRVPAAAWRGPGQDGVGGPTANAIPRGPGGHPPGTWGRRAPACPAEVGLMETPCCCLKGTGS